MAGSGRLRTSGDAWNAASFRQAFPVLEAVGRWPPELSLFPAACVRLPDQTNRAPRDAAIDELDGEGRRDHTREDPQMMSGRRVLRDLQA